MKVCQQLNQQAEHAIDIYGIVSNAFNWRFYQLALNNQVFESPFYSFETQMQTLFGILEMILLACEQNLPESV